MLDEPEGLARQKGDGKDWQLMRVNRTAASSTEGASSMASENLVLPSQTSHPLLTADEHVFPQTRMQMVGPTAGLGAEGAHSPLLLSGSCLGSLRPP